MAQAQQACFFLSCLPAEIRNLIYHQYTIEHVRDAGCSYTPLRSSAGFFAVPRLLFFEDMSELGAPLLRTCKQVFVELKPVFVQHMHFALGPITMLGEPSAQGYRFLPAALRSRSAVSHLHLNWYASEPTLHQHISRYDLQNLEIFTCLREVLFRNLRTLELALELPLSVHSLSLTDNASKHILASIEGCQILIAAVKSICPTLRILNFTGVLSHEFVKGLCNMGGRGFRFKRGKQCLKDGNVFWKFVDVFLYAED
ncbi:hypothetical protein MN608_09181 [Microdochium nivale]|nr:hypothetical protein MN608_09181 [Microdochium nivale]